MCGGGDAGRHQRVWHCKVEVSLHGRLAGLAQFSLPKFQPLFSVLRTTRTVVRRGGATARAERTVPGRASDSCARGTPVASLPLHLPAPSGRPDQTGRSGSNKYAAMRDGWAQKRWRVQADEANPRSSKKYGRTRSRGRARRNSHRAGRQLRKLLRRIKDSWGRGWAITWQWTAVAWRGEQD